jgi:hypothetical protein
MEVSRRSHPLGGKRRWYQTLKKTRLATRSLRFTGAHVIRDQQRLVRSSAQLPASARWTSRCWALGLGFVQKGQGFLGSNKVAFQGPRVHATPWWHRSSTRVCFARPRRPIAGATWTAAQPPPLQPPLRPASHPLPPRLPMEEPAPQGHLPPAAHLMARVVAGSTSAPCNRPRPS